MPPLEIKDRIRTCSEFWRRPGIPQPGSPTSENPPTHHPPERDRKRSRTSVSLGRCADPKLTIRELCHRLVVVLQYCIDQVAPHYRRHFRLRRHDMYTTGLDLGRGQGQNLLLFCRTGHSAVGGWIDSIRKSAHHLFKSLMRSKAEGNVTK